MENSLLENNYLIIKKFIDPSRASDLARSFKQYSEEHRLNGDDQAPFSASCYNYIDFLELLTEKTKEVSDAVGETVLPTYSYARVYRQGDELKVHKDRGSCEISLTINLQGGEEWPIWIKRPDGESVFVSLQPGDAMIYLGCEAEHWRDPIPCDEYIQVFLHYVKSRGTNFINYFDRLSPPHIENKNKPVRSNFSYNFIDCSSMPRGIRDYIKVFDDIIPDYLCDMILEEYNPNDPDWSPALVSEGIMNDDIRNVKNIKIDEPYITHKNFKKRQQIISELGEVMFWIMNGYKKIAPAIQFELNSGYELLKYDQGCFYKEHIDSFMTAPRHLAISLHLNDDYEGGEFAFFNKDLKIKAKKGSAVVFPSNFMYPHEILPVSEGIRYSIITWII